jgi:hypothetical protein
MPRRERFRARGADPFGACGALDALGAHEPGDLVTADVVPGPTSGLPQFPRAVDAVVVLPQPSQRRPQGSVRFCPRRGWAGLERVVGAHGHPHPCACQDGADGLDRERGVVHDDPAVRVDERDYLRCWRSNSAPKELAALESTISFARRSSRTSGSSSLIRARSKVLTRDGWPRAPKRG